MREERPAEVVGGGGTALCATGVEDEAPAVEGFITLDMVGDDGEDDGGGTRGVERDDARFDHRHILLSD